MSVPKPNGTPVGIVEWLSVFNIPRAIARLADQRASFSDANRPSRNFDASIVRWIIVPNGR